MNLKASTLAILLGAGATALSAAQPLTIPLHPERFTLIGEDLRFEPFLGRPSLHLGKGMVVVNDIELQNGTIEFDMATRAGMRFLGLVFHLQSQDEFESVFFRAGASGTSQSVQYQPNLHGSGTWQMFQGEGANAIANLPRDRWIPVKVEIAGDTARAWVGESPEPILTVPRLANGGSGGGIGFWTGPFGNGAYFSNFRYSRGPASPATRRPTTLAAGTIVEWRISEAIDAADLDPSVLPDLDALTWDRVRAEPWNDYGGDPLGLVLLNRYRRGPNINPPADRKVAMAGRVAGSKVVFARANIDADADGIRRMHFGYSDGIVIFANGRPLYFGLNPTPFRNLGGVMEPIGEAVYLPLKKGRNEVVVAVTEFFGGWGFWTRLDP